MKDPITVRALQLAKANGWNQAEFGRRLGVEKNNVTNWLARSMPAAVQIKAAKVLGVTVEELNSGKPLERHADRGAGNAMPVMDFSPDAWEFAREWDKLRGAEKEHIKSLVTALVTKQENELRKPKAKKSSPSVSVTRSPKHEH